MKLLDKIVPAPEQLLFLAALLPTLLVGAAAVLSLLQRAAAG